MNKLIAAMQQKDTTTHNGALSNSSTGSALVDFFGKGAALRSSEESEVLRYFSAAFQENPVIAITILFYLCDIRGGQGERRLFRLCLRWLANNHFFDRMEELISITPQYRRWDDAYEACFETPHEEAAFDHIRRQIVDDLKSQEDNLAVSLAAKWAPSENASSKRTKAMARRLRQELEMSPREYRKALSVLRERIRVVERQMSANEWGSIDFEKVPSRAAMIYREAFKRHQPDRYGEFISKVEKGEAKINASTLYPYDIVKNIMCGGDDRTLEAMWKAQPDYLKDNPHNGIVVADVSGSMTSAGYYGGKNNQQAIAPIYVCLSLAIYFAERNKGAFHDCFLTFSKDSRLQKLNGRNLKERLANLNNAEWSDCTNLLSAFYQILNSAKANNVPEADMPDVIYVISDMQFDCAVQYNSLTNLEKIKKEYEAYAYKLPSIVFWCVNAHSDSPVSINDEGVCLVSGCSPSILKTVLNGKAMTPYDVMMETINVARYDVVREALK